MAKLHIYFLPSQVPAVDANNTAVPLMPPQVHVHSLSHKHGLKHHKLTAHHDPHMSGLLSESAESAEAVVVVPAVVATAAPGADAHPAGDSASSMEMSNSKEVPTVRFKRDVADVPVVQPDPILLVPACPGRVRFF